MTLQILETAIILLIVRQS